MNSLKIANDIAKALISEKKMKLNARIDEIAIEKNMSVLEKAKLRALSLIHISEPTRPY